MSSPQVAILTPPGRGAVATIAVTGAGAAAIVDRLFQPAGGKSLIARPERAIAFGRWNGAEGEELVVCRHDDEHVEIHCHGGAAAPAAIVDSLVASGGRRSDWRFWLTTMELGSFSREAFFALTQARTLRTAAILLEQFLGRLAGAFHEIHQLIAEGKIAESRALIECLLARTRVGKHLVHPWRVVLSGRPNVGKSSLINALVGYERSIVYDAPGTTRDVVTASTAFDGWPVELSDTAGLRESNDALEAAGVERAQEQLRRADQILLVFDASQPWEAADDDLLAKYPEAVVVHNKCDLMTTTDHRPPGMATSATSGLGLAELQQAVIARLIPIEISPGDAVPFNAEHEELLRIYLRELDRHADAWA